MPDTPPLPHPFAHLGPGPYRVLGLETLEDRERINKDARRDGRVYTTNLAGGICHHCGTSITNVYIVRDSAGRQHRIGSRCVSKAAPALAKTVRALESARKARTTADKLARLLADPAVQAACQAVLYGSRPILEWAAWIAENAGNAGRARAVKAVSEVVARGTP